MSVPRVGVLALQGDTREHLAALRECGAEPMTVRRRDELDAVDALVIPGGESTTMSHLCSTSTCWDRCGPGSPMGFRPMVRARA